VLGDGGGYLMRYGRLDRKIRIQRATVTVDDAGGAVETWSDLVASRWASVDPVSGDERFSVPEIGAKQQTEFQIRWSSNVAGITPKDRIVYPVPASGSPETILDASIFDIAAVHEIGRREGLRIVAIRRTDVTG
jgi:SPP1 family predicted phage head-tail adaptor